MSLFALAISYLTTSNLSCFLDLTSQVPVQYRSLQHRTLQHPSSVTFTVGHYFRFGLASSFLLELFFHPSLVAYWVPTVLGSLSFSVIYFCLFILFMGFSRQKYWSLPFPSPVFVLSSYIKIFGFTDVLEGKESTCSVADLARFLGWEHPLEEDMANHSNILAWKIQGY